MIVRILSSGKSFQGCAAYLTRDADQAKTAERVEWTHTLNLANDDVPCAVNEMLWTARDAELLKQEAGIRAGGRAVESPVKHLSLNWSPDDKPTREHMVETTEEFLRHMKWQEHQAVIVAHNDKAYAHVHVMLNAVHPETGLKLNEGFEQRRAQEWALNYEREQGKIYCEQRLLEPEQREKSPPRNVWMQFWVNQKEFEKSEKSLENNSGIYLENPENRKNYEWNILKEIQRDERLAFFAEGKSEFSELRASIYRDVREAFRDCWAQYYADLESGKRLEELREFKEWIVAEQKAIIAAQRDEACKELREYRDTQYRALLDEQRDDRATLRERQKEDLDNTAFLEKLRGTDEKDIVLDFREAAREVDTPKVQVAELAATSSSQDEAASPAPRDDGVGDRLGSGVVNFFESLAYDLINLGSAAPVRVPQTDSSGRRLFEVAAEESTKRAIQHEREDEDAERRQRQRVHGD